jgi:hypothetical protein
MFSRHGSNNSMNHPLYPVGKYSITTPPPPLSRSATPPPPQNVHPASNTFYQSILSGLGLGMGASLGKEVVAKGLNNTVVEQKLPTPSHLNTQISGCSSNKVTSTPLEFCKKELEDYEESVVHFLHYNDYSVEEFYKKYKECLEDYSKKSY